MVSPVVAARLVARVPNDVVRARRGLASSGGTYLVTRRAHVRTSGRSTAALTAMLRRLPGSADVVDAAVLDRLRGEWSTIVAALDVDGITDVADAFTPDEVAEVVSFATDGPATLTHADGSASAGTYRDRGPDVVSVMLDQSFVLARPAVQAMLARSMAAEVAAARFGLWPTVHPPILYWSCRTTTAPGAVVEQRLARRYHSDFDGLGGLRLHVYLTDVDDGAAPMEYVRTSHRPGVIPSPMRRDVTDDIPIDQVAALFPADAVRTVTGPAGTSFMSDSNGLHRGTSPRTADRLFLVMPLQAGSFGGAYHRRRAVPVVNDAMAMALRARRPDLRLFDAAAATAKVATYAESAG
jgi:hypothetical protein